MLPLPNRRAHWPAGMHLPTARRVAVLLSPLLLLLHGGHVEAGSDEAVRRRDVQAHGICAAPHIHTDRNETRERETARSHGALHARVHAAREPGWGTGEVSKAAGCNALSRSLRFLVSVLTLPMYCLTRSSSPFTGWSLGETPCVFKYAVGKQVASRGHASAERRASPANSRVGCARARATTPQNTAAG